MALDGVRTWTKDNPMAAAVIGCLAALVAAAVILYVGMSGGGGGSGVGEAWYYDLQTGQPFVADASNVPPFTNEAGHPAVQAEVRVCGDGDEPFIAYLTKYTDEAAELVRAQRAGEAGGETAEAGAKIEAGKLVASVVAGAEPRWVVANEEPGQAIYEAATERCGQEPVREWPTDRGWK